MTKMVHAEVPIDIDIFRGYESQVHIQPMSSAMPPSVIVIPYSMAVSFAAAFASSFHILAEPYEYVDIHIGALIPTFLSSLWKKIHITT